jgi:hypothetical protein
MEERTAICRVAADILNKHSGQLHTGCLPAWVLGEVLTTCKPKRLPCFEPFATFWAGTFHFLQGKQCKITTFRHLEI